MLFRSLADGITEDAIRDALWAFNSPQVYGLLLHDLGWSPDRFEAWLVRSWSRLLLDPPSSAPGRRRPA